MAQDPTQQDLDSPEFNAVWSVIRKWDLDRGDISTSERCNYENATGTDVMTILNAIREVATIVPK